jgi:hypothetical protein
MLRQVPEYDMLILPPYDTRHDATKNSMDHLVSAYAISTNAIGLTSI